MINATIKFYEGELTTAIKNSIEKDITTTFKETLKTLKITLETLKQLDKQPNLKAGDIYLAGRVTEDSRKKLGNEAQYKDLTNWYVDPLSLDGLPRVLCVVIGWTNKKNQDSSLVEFFTIIPLRGNFFYDTLTGKIILNPSKKMSKEERENYTAITGPTHLQFWMGKQATPNIEWLEDVTKQINNQIGECTQNYAED